MPDYSRLDRFLHSVALGIPAVSHVTHDLERAVFLSGAPPFDAGRHVFVTSLARAGTTILMREIYATGEFGSLIYADMPFVLAPNIWSKLALGKRSGEKVERAHGDGIEVDQDSPEALDEVYWRVTTGQTYISGTGLHPHDPDDSEIDGYKDLIRLVLRKTGRARYLSKNNNLILRLGALSDAMPGSTFLVPIRPPLQHACSLLAQHRRFSHSDAFTQKYMTWLGHHEFGASHRPFLFGDAPMLETDLLDYWLDVWVAAHTHVSAAARERDNIVFVPSEDFSRNPDIWPALAEKIGLKAGPLREIRETRMHDIPTHDPKRADRAEAIYAELNGIALRQLHLSGAKC